MKFDIQLFNDTVTSSEVLQVKNVFVDDDTRTFDVPEPRTDITASEIEALSEWITANNALVGDKDGADFAYIESATKVETHRVKVDISSGE